MGEIYNLKLSPNKCEFRKKGITYVGHVFSFQGLKPDYEKFRAVEQEEIRYVGHVLSVQGLKPDYEKLRVVEQEESTYVGHVLSFQGLKQDYKKHFLRFIQYLTKFLQNMSEVSAPLRELLHKDIEWHCDTGHCDTAQEITFQTLKKMYICSAQSENRYNSGIVMRKVGIGTK